MPDLMSELCSYVSANEPLSKHTWFGLGGAARWYARPKSVDELAEVVRRARRERLPLKVLGFGANLLVSDDGVDGVVVRLDAPAFRKVRWSIDDDATRSRLHVDDEVLVAAGAGADVNKLVIDAARRGCGGLECMGGIPGTLGGIIRMNAGGRFGQIADVVRDVTVVDGEGAVRTLSRDEVGFSYRRTRLGDAIVGGATLALRPDDPDRVRDRLLEVWRYKKRSQPLAEYSAGCVFKNPPGGSAGQLIDQAGLKGAAVGGAHVSEQHANFIVAKEGATARDVMTLIGLIRRTVADRFGVELELEIEVWEPSRARSDLVIS